MIIVVLTAFSVHAFYWMVLRRGFRRAVRASHPPAAHPPAPHPPIAKPLIANPPPISVIVAARNEADALPTLLRALEQQDHLAYEMIVVDDGSTDRTREILEGSRIGKLRIVTTSGVGKKAALTQGIAAASHDLLAFTDADCAPPPQWLSALASEHAACKDDCVLIGYSPFVDSNRWSHRAPRSGAGLSGGGQTEVSVAAARPAILERLARYETFVTGFFTASAAGLGRPYMAVGRNISYPRSVFERVGGFASMMHSLSGDDDLFVQAATRRGAAQVRAMLDPQTFVPTPTPSTLREWVRQKRRHTSAGRYYTASVQAHLAAFHATNLLVWLAPFLIGWPGAALLVGKLGLQFFVLRDAAVKLRETDLIPIQPLLEPLYLLYNVVLAPLGLLKMPGRW